MRNLARIRRLTLFLLALALVAPAAAQVVPREMVVIASNRGETARRPRAAGATFVSSGMTELPQHEAGFRKGFLVRDPDGRVLRVIEP